MSRNRMNADILLQGAQECSEVTQEVTKLLQFGDFARDDDTGIEYDNVIRLRNEMCDVFAAFHVMLEQGRAAYPDKFLESDMQNRINEKVALIKRKFGA